MSAGRTVTLDRVNGMVEMEDVSFAYDTAEEVLHDSVPVEPGTVTHSSGRPGRKIDDHRTDCGVLRAIERQGAGDDADLATVKLNSYRTQLGVVLQELFFSMARFARMWHSRAPNATKKKFSRPVKSPASTSSPILYQIRHGGGRARRETSGGQKAARFHRARHSRRSAHLILEKHIQPRLRSEASFRKLCAISCAAARRS